MTRPDLRGVTSGDILLALAVLALVGSLAYPRLERARLGDRVGTTAAQVRTLRDGALRFRAERGEWPAASDALRPDAELAGYLPPGFGYGGGACALGWERWETVQAPADPVPIPEIAEPTPGREPPIPDTTALVEPVLAALGGISARCGDARILQALQDSFGVALSFIRDSSWTLVVPPSPEEP